MLLLSSSAFEDPKLLPFLIDAIQKPNESIKIAILVSASPLKSKGSNALKTMNFLLDNNISNFRFVDFDEHDDATKTLEDSDAIIILGGNPFLLLSTLREHDTLDQLGRLASSNKVVVGVSAGGMIFSPGLHLLEEFNQIMGFSDKGNDRKIKDLNCLNMFDEYFFPHVDKFSHQAPLLIEKLQLIESDRQVRIYKQANGKTALVSERMIEEI